MMKKTLFCLSLLFVSPSFAGSETAEQIMKRHFLALHHDLQAYLTANSNATDRVLAYQMAFQTAMMADLDEALLPLLEGQYTEVDKLQPANLDEALGSVVMQYASIAYEQNRKEELSAFLKRVVTTYKGKPMPSLAQGLQRAFNLLQRPAVGQTLSVEAESVSGTPVSLKALEDKVVLVSFWASWCGPCRAEFPEMRRVYEAYKDKGFEIISLSMDREENALKQALAEEELPWPVIWDMGLAKPHSLRYHITTTPSSFLVGKGGEILAVNVRAFDLAQRLDTLLTAPDKTGSAPTPVATP